MAKQAGINAPIYKIDIDSVHEFYGTEIEIDDIPAKLVAEYNKNKERVVYESQGQATIEGSYTELFLNIDSRANASSWVRFFKDTPINLPEDITNQLQHLMCFVIIDGELYAFTAGQSAVVFERFIDLSFPIDVGRRIAKPEVKSARANQITGTTLASDLHFRDPRRITYTESLDTVWSSLSSYLRDTLLDQKALINIFGDKNKIKLDVASSLRLGPKVQDPLKMIALIQWLVKEGEKDLPADDGWAALDAIKMLSPRKQKLLISELCASLAKQIFTDKSYENLALSHVDSNIYANATNYTVYQKSKSNLLYGETSEPSLSDIVAVIDLEDEDAKNLTTVEIETTNDDYGDSFGTNGTLLAHLNGEIVHNGRTYFLLSGKWYEVNASYIQQIQKDFLNLIESSDLSKAEIGLKDWTDSDSEGTYNESSLSHAEFINGDTILTDNIELFDTLAYKNNKLYIIHVKKGFNVKIRDVRSQILASAQVIENDLRNGSIKLKEHHAQLVEKGRTTLSESDFLNLFTRKRIYVLAYGRREKVTQKNIKKVTSSVAKMEIVSLNNQFRQITVDDSATLRITWIPIIQ